MRLCIVLSLVLTACSGADGGAADAGAEGGVDGATPGLRFPHEIVAKGCAKVLACANDTATYAQGLGHCVADLARNGALELGQQTALLSFNDDRDWLLELALMQNMDCVQAASGCTAILACLNRGQAQPACTPPAGYAGKRRCGDDTHLRGCSFSDSSTVTGGIETTIDCGAWGLACVETAIPSNGKAFATCAVRVTSPKPALATVTVTCQGDLARFEFGDGAYTFDCAYLGATCVPGDHPVEGDEFCMGKRAACDSASFTKRCEGSTLIECRGGTEAAQDCSTWGATCGTPSNSSTARCGFDCDQSSETCTAGVVRYCGPAGMTAFECVSIGMATCQIDATYSPSDAWCVP